MAGNQSPAVDNAHAQFVINLLLGHKMMMMTRVMVLVVVVQSPDTK